MQPRALVTGLLAVAGAMAVKAVLNLLLGQDIAYGPLFVALAVASVTQGLGAGLLVIVFGGALDALIFQSSGGRFFGSDPGALDRFLLFVPAGLVVAWLVAGGRRGHESARTEQVDSAARLLRYARVERARAAEMRAVLDSIDDAVAVFGSGGDLVLANEAMGRLAGPSLATEAELMRLLGRPPDAAEATSRGPVQIHLRNPDRWLEMRRFPVRTDDDGDMSAGASSLVALRDATTERVARETRETFLGILSHELRTPVTTILGIAHLLSRPGGPPTSASRDELASDVLAEAEHLHRLVEDLLVLSRTEGGRLEYQPEPLLIQHAIPPILAAERRQVPNVRFVSEVPASLPPVAGDHTYVDQVLRNIIGNAAKYSPDRGAEVRVQVTTARGEILVKVLDRGPGFDAEDADRLFDIFFRASRTAQLKAGAGIGLFVTKSLVEMMGGRVWARPRDGGGSEFGFALPILADDPDREDVR